MDDELRRKRLSLLMEMTMLWDEYRIPRYEIANAIKMEPTMLSHILAGRRPVALARRYDDIVAAMKELRESQEV